MTTAADDRSVEEAFEASLAGRPVPGEAAGLAAFTSAVRGSATQPGRPNAALAELLSTGLLTDQSSPSTRTAPAAGPLPSRSARSRTRRRFTVIVPALIAKLLSAGAIAQAATGAGVVVVVAVGAGATGALPDGAQETFSDLTGINETVDEPAGDLTEPEGTEPVEADDDLSDPADIAEVEVPVTDPVEDEADAGAFDAALWTQGYDPKVYSSFGAWVSLGAHNKAALAEALAKGGYEYRNFGAMVSAEARSKGMDRDELADELAEAGLDVDDVTVGEETETSDQDSGTDSDGDAVSGAGNSGKGNSGGKGGGHGNGGHGKGRGGRG
jgi:hypothetical protein